MSLENLQKKLICLQLKSQLGADLEIHYFQSFGLAVFLKGSLICQLRLEALLKST